MGLFEKALMKINTLWHLMKISRKVYTSIEEANAAFPLALREVGDRVLIDDGSGLAEYWYVGDTENSSLVLKSSTGTGDPQTIDFTQPEGVSYFDGLQIELEATATSGLPVTFTSLTPSVGTVSGTTLSVLKPGTIQIRASQPGNGTYKPAPYVTKSVVVSVGVDSLESNIDQHLQLYIGDSDEFFFATAGSGKPLTVTSSDLAVVEVYAYAGDEQNPQEGYKMKIIGSGESTITFTTEEGGGVQPLNETRVVHVDAVYEEIPFVPTIPRTYAPETEAAIAFDAGMTAYKDVLDNFIQRMKINGFWDEFWLLNVAIGDSKKLNLKNPTSEYVQYPDGFANGGVQLETQNTQYGRIPNAMGDNQFCMFIYNPTIKNQESDAATVVGCSNGDSDLDFYIKYNSRQYSAKIGADELVMFDPIINRRALSRGLYLVNTRDTRQAFYVGGSKVEQDIPLNSRYLSGLFPYIGKMNLNNVAQAGQSTGLTIMGLSSAGVQAGRLDALTSIINQYVYELEPTNPNNKDMNAIVYGDSIALGANADVPLDEAWPVVLKGLLGIDISWVQAQYGRTINNIYTGNNLYEEIFTDNYNINGSVIYNEMFKYMIIALGINDAVNWEYDLNGYTTQYRQILNRIVELKWPKSKIKLMTPYRYYGTDPTDASRWADITARVKALATEFNVQVIDAQAIIEAAGGATLVDPNDHFHLTTEGHAAIAAGINAVINS